MFLQLIIVPNNPCSCIIINHAIAITIFLNFLFPDIFPDDFYNISQIQLKSFEIYLISFIRRAVDIWCDWNIDGKIYRLLNTTDMKQCIEKNTMTKI